MLNNWDEEDFQHVLINYERMLKERPGDAELLRKYQIISLEYERLKEALDYVNCSNIVGCAVCRSCKGICASSQV